MFLLNGMKEDEIMDYTLTSFWTKMCLMAAILERYGHQPKQQKESTIEAELIDTAIQQGVQAYNC